MYCVPIPYNAVLNLLDHHRLSRQRDDKEQGGVCCISGHPRCNGATLHFALWRIPLARNYPADTECVAD